MEKRGKYMNDEEKKLLKTTCYYYGANFSNFPLFFQSINSNAQFKDNIKQFPWINNLYNEELKRIINLSRNTKKEESYKKFSEESGYIEIYAQISNYAAKFFEIENMPKLYIVDGLPNTVDGKDWESMSIDKEDEKRLGIPCGIYYKKKFLTHGYFEFVVAHELIHWIVSKYSKEYYPYVPLYEEGLCDFFSAILLYVTELFPIHVIKNLFMYNRYMKPKQSLWRSYCNFLNSSLILSHKYGVNTLIELVKSGRSNISMLDTLIFDTKISDLDKVIEPLITELLDINTFFHINVDDYIILNATIDNRDKNLTPKLISQITKIPLHIVEISTNNLSSSGYIFTEGKQILQMNNCKFGKIKYENF